MVRYLKVSCAAGLWIVGTLTGCANTQLKTVWVDLKE